jgi:cupin fold WbuC family metalloprotein
LFIILQGSASVLFFDEEGIVADRKELSVEDSSFAVEIPPQTWHTLVITSPETVLMEIKLGPYYPLTDKDFAHWSPEEKCNDAIKFERILREIHVGSKVSI